MRDKNHLLSIASTAFTIVVGIVLLLYFADKVSPNVVLLLFGLNMIFEGITNFHFYKQMGNSLSDTSFRWFKLIFGAIVFIGTIIKLAAG